MKRVSKSQLLKQVGSLSQVAGVRNVEFCSGKAKGVQALEVYNMAGIRFTVLPDKCMDILDLSYKGVNLGFSAKNGIVGNKFFNALGNEFLYNWNAGMLYTCGLANTGAANEDGGLYMTEHGRIGFAPAENFSVSEGWQGEDYSISLSGRMSESMIYGSHLRLTRKITIGLYDKKIVIEDTLENLEPKDEEFMLLYHINFGYPLVEDGAKVIVSKSRTLARTKMSEEDLDHWDDIGKPVDDYPEQVFYHVNDNSTSTASAAVINQERGLGAYISYSADTLPVLVHWKSMRSHDYTIGLEPSNSYIMGRHDERINGTLQTIAGYGQLRYRVEIGVLDGESEINTFKDNI